MKQQVRISRRIVQDSVRSDDPLCPIMPIHYIAGCATPDQIARHYARQMGMREPMNVICDNTGDYIVTGEIAVS